jgi:hypothetical protein
MPVVHLSNWRSALTPCGPVVRTHSPDIREALIEQDRREEYEDAVKAVLNGQEIAGPDVVSEWPAVDQPGGYSTWTSGS